MIQTINVDAMFTDSEITATASVSENIEASASLTTDVTHYSASDYNVLDNKPQINTVELVGNKSLPDIGVDSMTNMEIEAILQS